MSRLRMHIFGVINVNNTNEMQANNGQIMGLLLRFALRMNSAKWLDETGMVTFQSIFIFTMFGEFELWVLFVFEGRTLTIPRLPSEGFKKAKSGVWGRLHINDLPTSVGGI